MTRLLMLLCLLFAVSACAGNDDSATKDLPDVSKVVLDCGDPKGDVTSPGTLSSEAKAYLLCQHNEVRSEIALGLFQGYSGVLPVSKNMRRMEWDDNLATVASNYATGCVWDHNSNRTSEYSVLGGEGYVGENLYAFSSSGLLESIDIAALAVTAWKNEGSSWRYATSDSCLSSVCGHFTQLIWANTLRLGCGIRICPSSSSPNPNSSSPFLYVVCNYNPGGNYVSQLPYIRGDTTDDICSEGMQEGQTCQNGLISN